MYVADCQRNNSHRPVSALPADPWELAVQYSGRARGRKDSGPQRMEREDLHVLRQPSDVPFQQMASSELASQQVPLMHGIEGQADS